MGIQFYVIDAVLAGWGVLFGFGVVFKGVVAKQGRYGGCLLLV